MSDPTGQTDAAGATIRRQGDRYLEEGNTRAARECYQQVVEANPADSEAHLGLGICLLRENVFADAEVHLQQASAAGIAPAQTRYFLALAMQKQGKLEAAIANFREALRLQPDAEIVYGDLCHTLFVAGQFEGARATAEQAVAANPALADIYMMLGNLHMEAGQAEHAAACFRERLALDPRHAHAHYYLGELLQKQGLATEAMDHYRRAIESRPDMIEAYNNLGSTCFNELMDTDAAISWYQKALALRPDIAEIHFNLGIVYKARSDFGQAAACMRKAVEIRPDFALAYGGLGDLSQELGQMEQARSLYRKALEIKPDYADAHYGIASSFIVERREDESLLDHLRQALALDPEILAARGLMAYQMLQRCDWTGLMEEVRLLREAIYTTQPSAKSKVPPLAFLAFPGATAADQKQCAERWVNYEFRLFPTLRDKMRLAPRRHSRDKIRIGYLSADFRNHPVAFLMAEVFELHDRSRFHVTAYSYGPNDHTPMRQRLERAFDTFVELRDTSFEDAAKRIHADGTDILVDLTGHTQESRSAIMALRPAPVQVNYLGFPGTMGADFVDYMIADRFTVPSDMRQHYTEEVVWLPDCFQANDSQRPRLAAPSRRDCGLPDDGFVFCCFNQTLKITPDFFDAWCRLLNEVPGSILWLAATNARAEANLRAEAAARGVPDQRLIMAPVMHREQHLARLQCADLFLDTLPFNAGTTCSDALWMGLPVVTCAGEAFASRMAGSLLSAIGAPELITYTLDDYFRLARDLATDKSKYRAVREKILANRDTSPLFDTRRFVANLEDAFVTMMK